MDRILEESLTLEHHGMIGKSEEKFRDKERERRTERREATNIFFLGLLYDYERSALVLNYTSTHRFHAVSLVAPRERSCVGVFA